MINENEKPAQEIVHVHCDPSQKPIHVHCATCANCQQISWPFSESCLKTIFLLLFVLFLLVGAALTVLGFFNYGVDGPTSRAFRILGIIALLMCIGFFIASCVILIECVTSAIESSAVEDIACEELIQPSETFGSHYRLASQHIIGTPQDQMTNPGARMHSCPSCSCHEIHELQQVMLIDVDDKKQPPLVDL